MPAKPLQTAFSIAPTEASLSEYHQAEIEDRERQIDELAVEMQQLRAELADAKARLGELPPQEPLGRFETAREIEVIIANYFDTRQNIIVPNVSWGLFAYEMDLCVLRPNGDVYEIEIKVSKSDLRADEKKGHGHRNSSVSRLYFAIPKKMSELCVLDDFPQRAGILIVDPDGKVFELRPAKHDANAHKFDDRKRITLARLGTLRIWNLKRRLLENERHFKTSPRQLNDAQIEQDAQNADVADGENDGKG